jgi:hypothetical protein
MSEMNGAAIASQSAVLMARIVDATGRCVESCDIVSIRYSIVEVNADAPSEITVIAGHDRVLLDVNGVIFDRPEFGGLWTIDEQGYNFRHEIVANPSESFPKPHAHYHVVYEMLAADGQRSTVRFALRIN